MAIKSVSSTTQTARQITSKTDSSCCHKQKTGPSLQNSFGNNQQQATIGQAGRPARQGVSRDLAARAPRQAQMTLQPTAQQAAPAAQQATPTQAPQQAAPAQAPQQSQAPQESAHQVERGDTLSKIAERYGTTWQQLAEHNNISNPNLIHPGQQIRIPGTQAAPGEGPMNPVMPGGNTTAPGATAPGATAPGATPAEGPGAVEGPAATQPTAGGVSVDQLRQIMPHLSEARANEMMPHLNRAMEEAQINTPRRQAAFLAQLAHESGEFRYMEEIASGAAYEGRRDLGNTQPGDGRRFKGRGPIQLTGRHNYTEAGRALGLDLVGNPEQAATPEVGFRTSAWYWNSRDLNQYADSGNFDQITRRINGGLNGKADRDRYYARALQVLGG